MLFRLFSTLMALIAIAALALTYLVQQHIEQVVTVHSLEKNTHFTHSLEKWPEIAQILSGTEPVEHQGETIAKLLPASGVIQLSLFDQRGIERLTLYNNEQSRLRRELAAQPRAETATFTAQIDPERTGMRSTVLTGQQVWTYTSLLPLTSNEGTRIGFAEITLDVSDVRAAYASGLVNLALILFCIGVFIFAIPAIGYFLQKQVANRSQEDVELLAQYDTLTGALNRAAFLDRAQSKLSEAGGGYIAFVDIDKFKEINDTYGHAAGDSYLRRTAEMLKEEGGSTTLISRFGGDEFVLAFPTQNAAHVNERLAAILAAGRQEMATDGFTLAASLSIGVAPVNEQIDFQEALKKADTALYFSKSEGRNQAAFFDPVMAQSLERRREIEARLKGAVQDLDFSLVYQPLVDARTNQTLGFEALLRLEDNEGVEIPPQEFVPLAEEMGLIEEIGTWVLRQATMEISRQPGTPIVAVNLSSEQFRSGRLVKIVQRALEQAQLPANRLELELTESLLLEDSATSEIQIDALQELGVRVAMDDFGTGYSSLSYLWKYGFDRIKIDRSFISALEENPKKSVDIIRSIVLLGERLGMQVTAEGIETKEQALVLKKIGCDVLQGYYFGHPLPLTQPTQARNAS